MTLHGDFDETDAHADDHQAGCVWDKREYFRVMAHFDNAERALYKRKTDVHGWYYVLAPMGTKRLTQSGLIRSTSGVPEPHSLAREGSIYQAKSSLCVLCSPNLSWRSLNQWSCTVVA